MATQYLIGNVRGNPFTFEDFTADQLAAIKGEKGEAFTFEDFTPEQLASLKGEKGDAGDTVLMSAVEAETAARTEADQAATAALTAETAARQEADQSATTAIQAEAETRHAADLVVLDAITAESDARKVADTALQENSAAIAQALAKETTDRETAEATLRADIAADISAAAKSALDTSTALAETLDAETTARQSADNALANALEEETQDRKDADAQQVGALEQEITDRTTADAHTLETAQTAIDGLRTQLQELAETLGVLGGNFTRYNPMPVGAVYVQLPEQAAPQDLFGGTWENVSDLYAGNFFRAEGGGAAPFGQAQAAQLSAHSHELETRSWGYNPDAPDQTADGINFQYGGFRATQNATTQQTGGTENRPDNYAIRIWKRSE